MTLYQECPIYSDPSKNMAAKGQLRLVFLILYVFIVKTFDPSVIRPDLKIIWQKGSLGDPATKIVQIILIC